MNYTLFEIVIFFRKLYSIRELLTDITPTLKANWPCV